MTTKQIALTGLAIFGLLGTGWAQSGRSTARQEDKNTLRNLGIGLGAAALDSANHGRIGDALALGVGAALAGKKYEDVRKDQRDDRRYNTDAYDRDRYDRDRYDTPSRWERVRREREEREERERCLRERLERERRERIERERREREEREEREARLRWERSHRDHDRDWDRDCDHDRDRHDNRRRF